MTWTDLAVEHSGHWLRFDGPASLICHTCERGENGPRRLLIPLRPDLTPTPTPQQFRRPDPSTVASPEVIAHYKARALADLAARKNADRREGTT